MPSPAIRDLVRRLLAYETVAGKSSVPADPAALLVYEKLRRHLCKLVGVAGFQALASRALILTKLEAPGFGTVHMTADGRLQGFNELEPQNNKSDDDDKVGAILIAQLLGLLLTFIGEALTLRLLQDAWPEAVLDGSRNGRDA